jgi:pimeloyl-ACP methyl ester carboxylesterase
MQVLEAGYGNSYKVSYRKTGAGPVVMLVHGFPEDGALWDKIVPGMSESFTLLIPDLPGSGASPLPKEEMTMELMASSLKAVLDQEGIKQAVLAGHSMGGYASLSFAESHPSYVKGLSLVHSTATADNDEKKATRRKAIELIRKGGREAFIKQMVPGLFSEAFKNHEDGLIRSEIEKGLQLKAESMTAFYTAMINRPDRTGILKKGNFPVGWVVGKEDNVVPLELALKQAVMGEVSFVWVYENAAHMSMIEQPERLARDLKEFSAYCYNG